MHRPSLVTFRAPLPCDRPLGKPVGTGHPEPTANYYRGRKRSNAQTLPARLTNLVGKPPSS
jgi:hypothetical protein